MPHYIERKKKSFENFYHRIFFIDNFLTPSPKCSKSHMFTSKKYLKKVKKVNNLNYDEEAMSQITVWGVFQWLWP